MSVLVWDGTALAADSLANNGTVAFPFPKIQRIGSTIIGVVGPLNPVSELVQWAQDGLDPTQFPKRPEPGAQLVVVSKEKGLVRYNNSAIPILHGHNKIAIGEGAPFAYGALYMGATAEQAVAAAIHYCVHCNGTPEVLTL